MARSTRCAVMWGGTSRALFLKGAGIPADAAGVIETGSEVRAEGHGFVVGRAASGRTARGTMGGRVFTEDAA